MEAAIRGSGGYSVRGIGQIAKLGLEEIKIDRLGDEFSRTILAGQTPPLIVAIGAPIITGRSGRRVLISRGNSSPSITGIVYVRQDHDQLWLDPAGKLVECDVGKGRSLQ